VLPSKQCSVFLDEGPPALSVQRAVYWRSCTLRVLTCFRAAFDEAKDALAYLDDPGAEIHLDWDLPTLSFMKIPLPGSLTNVLSHVRS
jgi:hypothetical protein